MKQKVSFSTFSMVLSSVVIIVLLVCLYICREDSLKICVIGVCFLILLLSAMFYMPLSVSVSDLGLKVNRPLRGKLIPLDDIESVKLCSPTMSERRVCGSGGWFGYWGRFSEPTIGEYFAYYGKSSDCFLLKLKNGKGYVIGCNDPGAMVAYINGKIA